jgi:hypothetical protein
MANEFINQIKNRRRSSQIVKAPNPVLTAEDEAFLQQVTAEPEASRGVVDGETPQPLAVDEEAANIPLPVSPADEFGKQLGEEAREKSKDEAPKHEPASQPTAKASEKKKKNRFSAFFTRKNSVSKKVCSMPNNQLPRVHANRVGSRINKPANPTRRNHPRPKTIRRPTAQVPSKIRKI